MKDYPAAVFRHLLPRIVVYQILWFLYAVKSAGLGPYVRGLRGAYRGRKPCAENTATSWQRARSMTPS